MPVINTIRGADMVWLQVNAMSHNYFYRVIDICRRIMYQYVILGRAVLKDVPRSL